MCLARHEQPCAEVYALTLSAKVQGLVILLIRKFTPFTLS